MSLQRRTGLAALIANQAKTSTNALYFDRSVTFMSLGLDRRLFKAVARTGYVYPSVVQAKSIPLILEGKDVLVKARTGTGKTAAYVLPLLHQILKFNEGNMHTRGTSQKLYGIILVPTRDLCEQVRKTVMELAHYCSDTVSAVALSGEGIRNEESEIAQLRTDPTIVISTPSRLLHHIQQGNINTSEMKHLVVDEADLVLSYGYEEELNELVKFFPKIFQCVFMSATLSPELARVRGVLMHNPVVVQLDDNDKGSSLQQYYVQCSVYDKFLLVYVHIVFGLFRGKTIFFVNSIEAAFKLKLFLEQFHIPSVVLNDDLPFNSRANIIRQFNEGDINYLIATDVSNSELDADAERQVDEAVRLEIFSIDEEKTEEKKQVQMQNEDSESEEDASTKLGKKRSRSKQDESDDEDDGEEESDEEEDAEGEEEEEKSNDDDEASEDSEEESGEELTTRTQKGGKDEKALTKREKEEEEYNKAIDLAKMKLHRNKSETGIARGVDFVDVTAVVNVDFPQTVKAYIHRAGRTARAGKAGQVFSYVSEYEMPIFQQVLDEYSIRAVGKDIIAVDADHVKGESKIVQELPFDISTANAFRYRTAECLRRVTMKAVKEARLRAIQLEMLNSEKLKAHFAENPHEAKLLRHNRELSKKGTTKAHLNFVPSYLIPEEYRKLGLVPGAVNHEYAAKVEQQLHNQNQTRGSKHKKKKGGEGENRPRKRVQNDPLRTFRTDRDEIVRKNTFKEFGGQAVSLEEKKRRHDAIKKQRYKSHGRK